MLPRSLTLLLDVLLEIHDRVWAARAHLAHWLDPRDGW